MEQGPGPSAKRQRLLSSAEEDGADPLRHMIRKDEAELDQHGTTSSTTTSASSSTSFESIVQDEVRYRGWRHAPLPPAVARTLQSRAEWANGVGAHQQRCAEEAVQRKQAELDRTNHLYKALARKSFQLSVTLLHRDDATSNYHQQQQHPPPSSATTPSSSSPSHPSNGMPPPFDIHRTIVLPAGTALALFFPSFFCFYPQLLHFYIYAIYLFICAKVPVWSVFIFFIYIYIFALGEKGGHVTCECPYLYFLTSTLTAPLLRRHTVLVNLVQILPTYQPFWCISVAVPHTFPSHPHRLAPFATLVFFSHAIGQAAQDPADGDGLGGHPEVHGTQAFPL